MAMLAGMVRGTPGWQKGRSYETDTERDLEKAFDEDFPAHSIADDMSIADFHLGQAVSFLCRAANLADRWNRAKEIDELIERLEDLRCDVSIRKEKMLK